MFREMNEAGLPDPEYRQQAFMTIAEVSRRTGYDGILIQELLVRLRQKGVLDREEDDLFGRWILL
jgi:predicted transcriptional regulator of viral defense system